MFNVIPAQIVKVDCWVRLVLYFHDWVIGRERLGHLIAIFSAIRTLKNTAVSWRLCHWIIPLLRFNQLRLVPWYSQWCYKFDGSRWTIICWRVVDMVAQIAALQQLIVQSAVFWAVRWGLIGRRLRKHSLFLYYFIVNNWGICKICLEISFFSFLKLPDNTSTTVDKF
jgi:hypothetical protein